MTHDHNKAWALRLAEAGISVFPCNPNPESEYFKKPAIKDWDGTSSCDPAKVAQMWAERPGFMPAIDLRKCGLIVLDGDRHHEGVDGRTGLRNLLRQAGFDPSSTPCAITPRDGVHVYFQQNGHRLGNRRGSLPEGIDVRGDGGYVIAPYATPTCGERYRAVPKTPDLITAFATKAIAPIPEAIARLLATKQQNGDGVAHENKPHESNKQSSSDRERAYATAALSNLTNELATIGKGGRNAALNTAALKLGHMIARGWIGRSEVEQALIGAMKKNGAVADDGMPAALATLRSGIEAGMAEPHEDLQDRPRGADDDGPTAEGGAQPGAGVSLDDFHAYMEQHSYIYTPTRQPWPVSSVNARLGKVTLLDSAGKPKLDEKGKEETIPASAWLDQNKPVEQMTWAPGLPMLIRNRLVSHGGWINRPGTTCFNLYLPPTIVPGNAAEADPWLDHINKIYPTDADHIICWLAQRAQQPAVKINHALVLGGPQGIGKDTLLDPVKQAIGPWNFIEVSPSHMLGRFNGFLKSVILRVNEARDLGDVNRYQFYDHLKAYTAAPPDVLRVDEKHLREHSVINCCGVIITSNHKTDGIYLPADDRRHFVAWSDLTKDDFTKDYWNSLWGWYANGGACHVAAYLAELDLSGFDPKAPPPKTAAFWAIVDASRAPEDAELADVLDRLGNPVDGPFRRGVHLLVANAE